MPKVSQGKLNVLKQVCELIPQKHVTNSAKEFGVDKQARTFTPWSHVVSLCYAQLAHSISLNDICDSMTAHSGKLSTIRKAVAPKKNTLSHANRTRDANMAERLFWQTLNSLENQLPNFGKSRKYNLYPKRFKRMISPIDSSTISLVANCMDWAKHRRRKAAAKLHLTLDLQTFLPRFVIVEKAKHHDSTRAKALASLLSPGEIATFDKAYIKYNFLHDLTDRGVFWVGRSKDNMAYKVIEEKNVKPNGKIIRDCLIELTKENSFKQYPEKMRLVEAMVEINGKEKRMTFITNNLEWAASSICEIYKCRWAIEVFFKELKQNLQLADFIGYSENAIRWQVWIALLTYIILRFIAEKSKWNHSFKRLVTVIRALLWHKFILYSHLQNFYGTASGPCKIRSAPSQALLPGFDIQFYGTA